MRLLSKIVCALFFMAILQSQSKAQTTLTAGDIAFSGYTSNNLATDEFSFVLLKAVVANTVINFTDNGWLSTNVFRSGEQNIIWTSNAAYAAGTEIKINGLTATLVGGGSAGTVTGTALSLSTGGDQVLAFQGTIAAPSFISAIHMNVYSTAVGDPVTTTAAAWDGTANTASASALPTGLTTGTNAIWIGTQGDINSEFDNSRFTGCALDLSTIALVRAALNNQANWSSDNTVPPGFTLPTGCSYIVAVSAPVITIPPVSSAVCAGANAGFSITATGATSYQWQADNGGGFVNITNDAVYNGVTTTALTVTAAPLSFNSYQYRCVATNGSGSTNSAAATLTVNALPDNPTLLARTPNTATVADGTPVSATFNAGSGGTGCADDFRYTTNGGASYLPYTPGSNISTTGLAAAGGVVTIEGRRANCSAGCQNTYAALVTWVVTPLPAAATTLNAGDLAFSSYAAANDEFSFVLLRNIGSGTVVNFTNNGWLSTNVFRTGEETVTWTSNAAYAAGTEIKISGTTATLVSGASAGTVTGTALNLSAGGDQILAYRGTAAAPTFITAIHMNVNSTLAGDAVSTTAAAWDGSANNTSSSALPTGLTTGVNAIWIGTQDVIASEFDNARYGTCSSPATLGGISVLRAALNNPANWIKNNNAGTPGFVIPTGCNYLGQLAAPNITGQPANAAICESGNTSFTITATGASTYQWQVDPGSGFVNITDNAIYSGATTATLNITAAPFSINNTQYRCIATNGTGSAISNSASLTLTPLAVSPTLLAKTPASGTVADGTPVSATFNPGSGGAICTDDFRYTTDGGVTYLPYTPGANISTTGLAAGTGWVFIEGRRAGCSGILACDAPYRVLASWYVTPLPAAATTLNAGDIAFSAYTSTATDEFSFVLLKTVGAGTVINFTNNGWLSTNVFRTGEETVIWTAPAGGLTAGTEIKISGLTATKSGGGAAGTVTGTALNLSTSGDQVLAYRGTAAAPTFISAIHMNVYTIAGGDPTTTTAAAWDGTANTASASALPAGLTTGVNCIWIGTQGVSSSEFDNAAYGTCAGPGTLGPLTGLRAALNNQANWVRNNNAVPGFAIPTGCNYLSLLAPSVNVTGTPLTAFVSCAGTASAEQNFTVSGSALTTNIIITAPTGFEISTTSGSGFGATLTLTQSGGSVPGTTIYVRLAASATGTPSGNITVASAGVTTVNVAVSGTVNPVPATPTITPGGPTTFCAGGSVTLTSSSATGNVWSTGATTQSITVSTSGTYTVTVTTAGCSSAASAGITVTVNPAPATPTITPGGPTTFCAGGSVTLTSSSATGNVWSTGATTQSLTVSTGGTYTVTVTSGGCSATSAGTTVTVNPLPATPTITPGGPTTFCTGGSVTLTSSSASGNLWSTGETTQSITVTTSGTYTVSVTSGGCTSAPSAGTTVTVNPIPATPTITAGGPTTFCTGGSVTLTSSSATGNLWSTGATTQSITVSTAGTYTVTVTQNGCTSATSAGTTVTVDALPTTANAGPDLTACINPGTANMAANPPTVGTGAWTQIGGPATTSFGTNNPITIVVGLNTAGTYTYVWTISNGTCAPSRDTMTITVNPNPATFTLAGGGTFCPGTTTLTGPVVPNSTYTWQRSLSGIANPNSYTNFGGTTTTQDVTSSGNYRLVITNQFGCSTSDSTPVNMADYVFNGSLATGDAQQTGRLNRFATVSTCAAPKSCPLTFTPTGARFFDSYTITNPRNVPVCATVGLRSDCGTSIFNVAYLGSFNPTSLCTNYLADPGSSFPGTGYMEVTIPANATIVVVVHEVNPGTGCTSYQLTVDVPRETGVTVNPGTPVCSATPVTLTAPLASSYSWNPGGNTTQAITVSPAVTSKYFVTLGYGNVGCTTVDSATVVVGSLPTAAFAGNDTAVCGLTINNLAANTPVVGTGIWTLVTGPGTINFTNANAPNSGATVSANGVYTLRWTIATGAPCINSTQDDVLVNFAATPSTADAGLDKTACVSPGNAGMTAAVPTAGTGVWTQVAGPVTANIISPNLPNTTINGMNTAGTYTFRWTVSNNPCPSNFDEVNVVVSGNPASFSITGGGTFCPTGTTLIGPVNPNYTYQWGKSYLAAPFANLGTGQTENVTSSGIYQLVVTNQFGCSTSATTVVNAADYVFNGSLAAGDATQTGRLNRFANISTCASPKACPGTFTTAGSRVFDSYTITNPRPVPVCAVIGLNSGCGTAIFSAAYSGSFDPNNLCNNYLADPGSSPATSIFYEATIPANGTIVVVVHEVNPGQGCANYTLTVDVPRDGAPIVINPPTVTCASTATLTAPVANSYLWAPGGATTRSITTPPLFADTKYKVTLGYGNNGCNRVDSATVTVTSLPPAITCPANISASNTPGICGRAVTYTPTVGGLPAPAITYAFTGATVASGSGDGSGSVFNVGVTTVTLTATNACGNVNCSFTVTITDNQAPTVTAGTIGSCYPTVAAAQAAALAATSATDNCPGVLTETASTVGTCSAVVTVRTTDAAGNFTDVTYNTRIDNTAPTVTVGTIGSCYPTVAAAEAAALAATSATDNCPGALTEVASTVGTCSAVVTVTTTDGCGNATAVTYNTRIDNTAPTVTVGTIGSCYPTVAAAEAAALAATSATDNCPGALTEVASTVGTCSAVVTVTTTDGCGNATAVTYNTRIDNTPPALTCPAAVAVCGTAAVPAANIALVTNVTDNCPGAISVTHQGDVVNGFSVTAPYTITRTYRATDGCGNFTDCTQTITVNPIPTVNTVADQVLCNTGASAAINFGSPVAGTTYSWTNNTTSIGLAASGTGNIASFTATNTGIVPVTATITVTPSANGCPGPSITFTITVNPTPTVNAVSSQALCNGAATAAISFSGVVAGTAYNWVNNNTSIGLPTNGTGNIGSFTAVNVGSVPVVATITVTPVANNCPGASRTFTITVNPTPTVKPVVAQALCNGAPTSAISFNGDVANTTYSWVNNTPSIGLPATGIGDIASFTATNTGTVPVTATITVTPSANGCIGLSGTFTITVNPTPAVNTVASQALCNTFTTAAVTFSGPVSGTTYNWTNNTASIGLAASGTGNIPAFTAVNTGAAPVVATITVTPTSSNGCVGASRSFTITVNPTPVVTLNAFAGICKNAATITLTGGSPAGGTYFVDGVAQTVFNPANYTVGNHTITYRFTNIYGCTNTSSPQTIEVYAAPVSAFAVSSASGQCLLGNVFTFANNSTGAISYLWNFGDGTTSTSAIPVKSYLAAGTYTITLTATTSNGCQETVSRTVTVYPQPAKPVVIPEFGNGIRSSVVENSYTWFLNNNAISGSNARYFYPQVSGQYQVQVATIFGCTAKSDSLFYIPEKFFAAGADEQFVFVYPKPVRGDFINVHFNIPTKNPVQYAFFTESGQLLTSGTIPRNTRTFNINVKRYPSGAYVLKLTDNFNLVRGIVVPILR